jgi:hypothetical protein
VLYNRATCCHLAACKPFYKAFLCKGKSGAFLSCAKHAYLFVSLVGKRKKRCNFKINMSHVRLSDLFYFILFKKNLTRILFCQNAISKMPFQPTQKKKSLCKVMP